MTAVKIAIPRPRGSFKQRKQVPIGTRFGHLITITPVRWELSASQSHRGFYDGFVDCRCDCGNQKLHARVNSLKMGKTKSCGCSLRPRGLPRGVPKSHGGCVNGQLERLYKIWHSMRLRCSNSRHPSATCYYNRGIRVCREWNDYSVFREWAFANGYQDGLSIDRIDSMSNYEPSNCQWISRSENCRKAAVDRKAREDWMVREILRLTARVDELEREKQR